MFACIYSLSTPLAALLKLASDFTPRFEVIGPLVMLDVSGLSRLFGTPREIGEQMRRDAHAPVRIAIAPTQTAAALLALGRPGLTVVAAVEQADTLAPLQITLLGEFERLRLAAAPLAPLAPSAPPAPPAPPAPLVPVASSRTQLHSASSCGGGWTHPRDGHAAVQMRRERRAVPAGSGLEHSHAASAPLASASGRLESSGERWRDLAEAAFGREGGPLAPVAPRLRATQLAIDDLLATLRRWGVRTFGQLAALPPGEVYERLGARGVTWQRLARGEDLSPLVPWVADDPFEASLELEWPIAGLEPLSFVLARLLEPMSERLERADRGAAILYTHLRLVDKTVHARTLQLPAPMRDAKTLRTLLLLDLESHPPSAAIDCVRVLIEPTPARVTQWALFERAQPSPEQVSTLLARLTALMGGTHVGSPKLLDSWRPGAFEMTAFAVLSAEPSALSPRAPHSTLSPRTEHSALSTRTEHSAPSTRTEHSAPSTRTEHFALSPRTEHSALSPRTEHSALSTEHLHAALRRFRLPIPARVQVQEGRPVRIVTDRRGVNGGPIVQAAGPWRTSGEWWNDGRSGAPWDRDEWDAVIADGTVYRLYLERDVGQWFLEGIVD
jgi:hypothetical protein